MSVINSQAIMISSKLALGSAQKTQNAEKKETSSLPQHTEAYSSTYSNALRASFSALIKRTENTPPPQSVESESVNYTEGVNCKVVSETTGEEANKWWMEEMGYDKPPYLPKSKVQIIELQEDTKFCRVYDGENSGMFGGWVMKQSDVEGLTPEEIQDKFALPQKPVKICDVTLPAGTQMRTGLCNPLDGWGNGKGVQFDLMGQRVGEFGNERDIQTG